MSLTSRLSEIKELLGNIINSQSEIQFRDEYKIKAIHGMLNEIWGNIIDEWD